MLLKKPIERREREGSRSGSSEGGVRKNKGKK